MRLVDLFLALTNVWKLCISSPWRSPLLSFTCRLHTIHGGMRRSLPSIDEKLGENYSGLFVVTGDNAWGRCS